MNCITGAGAVAIAIASLVGCASTVTQPAVPTAARSATTGSATAATTDLNGTWRGVLTDPEGQKHGSSVTGTFVGAPPEGMTEPLKGPIRNGKLEGNQLTFMTSFGPDGPPIAFKGTVGGSQIRGVHGSPEMGLDMQWEVTKH
jgi:hypothetical protein